MLKVMLLVRRREGLSRADFREYYEQRHAPLASEHMARCVRYVRNFVEDEPTGPQDFDVITEFWFDVDEPYAEGMAKVVDAATVQLLAEDEARFMDRDSMRAVSVVECETDPATLSGGRA